MLNIDVCIIVGLELIVGVIFTIALATYFKRGNGEAAPITLLSIAGLLALIIILSQSFAPMPCWITKIAGSLFIIAGGVLFIATALHMKNKRPAIAFSSVTPSAVETKGPFSFIRHPFYASYCLYWIGGGIIIGLPFGPLPIILMAPFYILAARREEAIILASQHSAGYQAYLQRVGMFWPRAGQFGFQKLKET